MFVQPGFTVQVVPIAGAAPAAAPSVQPNFQPGAAPGPPVYNMAAHDRYEAPPAQNPHHGGWVPPPPPPPQAFNAPPQQQPMSAGAAAADDFYIPPAGLEKGVGRTCRRFARTHEHKARERAYYSGEGAAPWQTDPTLRGPALTGTECAGYVCGGKNARSLNCGRMPQCCAKCCRWAEHHHDGGRPGGCKWGKSWLTSETLHASHFDRAHGFQRGARY